MDAWKTAVLPDGEMQDCYLAETDEKLGVRGQGCKVQTVGDSIRAFAASGRDYRPDPRITDCSVQIGQSVLIGACQIPELVQGMSSHLRAQAERLQI